MNDGWLSRWLGSGHAIDLTLAIVALEVLGVFWWLRRRGQRLTVGELIGPVGAGVLLMLALRTALVGGPPELIALWLLASFPAHVYDLRKRLRAPS